MENNQVRDPELGDKWEHRNGIVYDIIGIANEANDNPNYPKQVVYVNQGNGTLWARPLSDWHRSFTFVEEMDFSEEFLD